MTKLRQEFSSDYDVLVTKIFINKENLAFSRYNEGEYGLISGKGFSGAGKIWGTVVGKNKLKRALMATMYELESSFIYGIASQQHAEASAWYKGFIESEYKTFATIWVNNNWKRFRELLYNIKEDVVIVGNRRGKSKKYPFNVIKYFPVEEDCVSWFEDNRKKIDRMCDEIAGYKDKLVLFCAGPLSNYMIHRCRLVNDGNRYIDIGSCLDEFILGRQSRGYFRDDSKTYNQIDKF